jgi:hypothetical protein
MIAGAMRASDITFAVRTWLIGLPVPDAPHLDPEGLAVFEASLKTARRYLEFGAGGSTIMAAHLGKNGISIEGDRRYHQSVQQRLRGLSHGIALIHVDVGRTGKWGRLLDTTPTPERVAAWTRYASTPFAHLTGDFFDLVLVDGRFRVACALHTLAAARLRRASFRMLLDDYDNPQAPGRSTGCSRTSSR